MTIMDVWERIDHDEYGTEWTHEAVHEFQENLRDVFEAADQGEDWVRVWNAALSIVDAVRTSIEIPEEKQFHAWMKFIVDVVLNYYYYFWDFDALEGCDVTHIPTSV